MFITQKNPENEYNDDLSSLYKTKYRLSPDIQACKRTIVLHDDIDISKSSFEGIYMLKCTVINLSVLDGKYHHDLLYTPETILAKTVYNGYVILKTNNFSKEYKIDEEFLNNSKFRLVNAYTSCIGVWSTNSENDNFASFGVSVLDMIDLKNAVAMRKPINIYSDGNITMKLEISFDGNTYQQVLPLPQPQFYSRLHSENFREEPIITSVIQLPFSDICDEYTKIIRVGSKGSGTGNSYEFETNNTSSVEYLSNNGSTLVQQTSTPMHVVCGLLRSLSDELYSKLFKLICRYQLASINFVSDVSQNKFSISSMMFSYDNPPDKFAETVTHEILTDDEIRECLNNMRIIYGNIRIFGRITDLRYDITILFVDGHKDIKELKYVKYKSSIFDIWSSLINLDTSITAPIISY